MAKKKDTTAAIPAEEAEWRADSDLRTLIEAEKIKRDPKRLRAAMRKRREMQSELKAIKD